MTTQREEIIKFAKNKYNVEPEFLWEKFPSYAILRNPTNKKWFAAIMSIKKNKLGLTGTGEIEVMNIKCDEFGILQLLDEKQGFLPAYHMNKKHWISVLLDNSVNIERIKNLIELSYDLVNKKTKK